MTTCFFAQLPRTLKIISHHVLDPCGHSFETLPLQSVPYLQSFIVETRMLVKLPAEFGFPASLVDLKLNCCTQLPKDISKLVHLERLTLHKCQLEFLPQGMGKLKKLKHLSMQQCTKLASLPEEIELLSSLEELSMRECVNLRELPQGFGGLSSVQNLDLTGCITLKTLPESFAELRIESLILESLLSLEELPYCIGKMPCLSHLKLIACHSLPTLPNSFVHLKCLQTLKIIDCENLVALPKDFGQLSFLSEMIVRDCPKLEELPHGFQALPVLKIFRLLDCSSLVNLPSGFGELRCLEILELRGLLITGLPDGFGNLKRLRILRVNYCSKLETLPDDFETLASLTWIEFTECDKLDGAAMERIAKLRHAYYVDIEKSAKLIERWRKMRQEDESLMVVWTEENHLEDEERKRAARLGLLCGKCVELDNTGQQLIERSASMLFEEDTAVAVIALPVHMGFHQQLPAFVEAAIGKAKTGRLRIFYVKRVKQEAETTAKEKEEEEECFRQILKSMPKGTCAVPSTDIRRHRLLTYVFFDCHGYRADNKLACCMVNITLDDENHKFVELKENFGEEDISGEVLQRSESADKESKFSNSIGNFIESVRSGEFSVTAMSSKQSQFTEFLRILKENGADHLIDSKLNQVQLDKLKSNVVGIFICDINTSEYIKLDHIYKELKSKDHNFEMIWIPLLKNEFYGLGTYTRAIQKMSWTVLPNPNLVKEEIKCPLCIIFDQEGKIVNEDALSAMMSWGVEAFPFTKIKIHQIVSTVQAESSLDFLFNNLNLVNKGGVLENKLTFLYAETPSPKLKMKFSLEQLEQLNSNVQIVYVGNLFEEKCDITTLKDVYEDVIQEMHWPKLSFEDMFTFWYRCKCVSGEMEDNLNLMIQDLKLLTKILCIEKRWLVVLDTNGVVTRSGYEIVKMCKINDEKTDEVDIKIKNGLLECLQSGKCNQIVRTFFRDININHSKHSQHPLAIEKREILGYYCNSCYSHETVTWDKQRRYRCNQCDWDLCAKCWILFVKGEIQNSHQE